MVATGLSKLRYLLPKNILHGPSLAHQFKIQILGISTKLGIRLPSRQLEPETPMRYSSSLQLRSTTKLDGGHKGVSLFPGCTSRFILS